MILPQHLLLGDGMTDAASDFAPSVTSADTELRTLQEIEKEYVAKVLQYCGFNQTKAASILGIDRKTLRNKIREFGLGTEIAVPNPDYEN
jgi:DNA-binding NtrC family response regulator